LTGGTATFSLTPSAPPSTPVRVVVRVSTGFSVEGGVGDTVMLAAGYGGATTVTVRSSGGGGPLAGTLTLEPATSEDVQFQGVTSINILHL
jgi:hypothetical protein